MRIRPTLSIDIPLLPAVERSAAQAFLQRPELAWLADGEVLDETAHLAFLDHAGSWVAVDDDERPLGFLCAAPAGSALHIHELSVRQGAQGQGIGRALLDEALRCARQRGLRQLTLTTFAQVPWNAPFYERYGFENVSERDTRLSELLRQEQAQGLNDRCAMRLLIR
ncbi:GNAT family N-acetyltransferase [Pseudomonas entomophila]|uniref:GNAT family N-acetyltransferase n=1 Tax=Pseudomonas entomophila TaxID=312306 RepID=UPI0023D8A154|nr:GNAT family N-acetyltransferase [Pseudomonas entomophila]MDF0732213.1 GNAT family N-acetyltransferase [Pseudomonas entomophila]